MGRVQLYRGGPHLLARHHGRRAAAGERRQVWTRVPYDREVERLRLHRLPEPLNGGLTASAAAAAVLSGFPHPGEARACAETSRRKRISNPLRRKTRFARPGGSSFARQATVCGRRAPMSWYFSELRPK